MKPRRTAAFTLVEMTIVAMIMGILMAAATPVFYDSLLFHRVESAARRVKADLELVRQTSRLTSNEQTLTVTGTTYTTSAAITDLDRPTQTYSVDLAKPPYSLTGVTANFNGTGQAKFNGYGLPAQGGTIVLTCGAHQCTVAVDVATGTVTIASGHTGGRTAKLPGS